jgi:hypothetical protein
MAGSTLWCVSSSPFLSSFFFFNKTISILVEWADSWVNGQFMWLRSDRLPRLILQLDFFFLEKTGHKKKRDSCARLNWCTETSKRATFPLIVHAASVYELSRCRLAYPLLDWRVIQRLKSSIWNNIFKAYPSFWSTFYSTWKNILKVSQSFWSTVYSMWKNTFRTMPSPTIVVLSYSAV